VDIGLLVLAGVALLLTIVELVLRKHYGLGTPPLYVADARTGYRLAPNQTIQRRGNWFEVNQYSMRGSDFQLQRSPAALRVLLLGDSIVNGGWWTDQAQILSQVVQDALVSLEGLPFRQFEVLNASANSWGPRNELGYVVRFGVFEAQVVLLVLNTDDLFAVTPNAYQLNRSPSYPTRRPPLALVEVIQRVKKPPPIPALQDLHEQSGDRVGANLEALRQLNHLVKEQHSRLLLAMTPLKRELGEDGPRDYERVARHRLQGLIQAEDIPYLDFLPLFQQEDYPALYRDHIHLSPRGNELVGKTLAQFIAKHWISDSKEISDSSDDVLRDLW
jgi:hypothetical protein